MCFGAGSGAPWRPYNDGDRHDRSMRFFSCCRKRPRTPPLPPSLTPPPPRIVPSQCAFPANAAQRPIRPGGCQADDSDAGDDALPQRASPIFRYMSYVFLRRTQTTKKQNARRCVMTEMVGCGRHGAPHPEPLHRTVAQHVG